MSRIRSLPSYFLRDLEDPPRNGATQLTIVADSSVPFGLLHCSLFVNRYSPRGEVKSKSSPHTCSYFIGRGTHRLLVRATFPGSITRYESNVVYFVAEPDVDLLFHLVFTGEHLVLQGTA